MSELEPSLGRDPIPAVPAKSRSIHPKVASTAFAGAIVALVLRIIKHYGLDLSDYEGEIIVVVGMLVGYMTRG